MDSNRRIRAIATATLVGFALAFLTTGAPAQDVARTDNVPLPADCTVSPRPAEEFVKPTKAPPPTFAAVLDYGDLPSGPAPTAEVVAAIKAVEWEYAACLNAGDFQRASALYTDGYFARLRLEMTPDDIGKLLVPREPLPEYFLEYGHHVTLVEPIELPNGQLGALVGVCEHPPDPTFVIFAQADGRWLIDDRVRVISRQWGCTPAYDDV